MCRHQYSGENFPVCIRHHPNRCHDCLSAKFLRLDDELFFKNALQQKLGRLLRGSAVTQWHDCLMTEI